MKSRIIKCAIFAVLLTILTVTSSYGLFETNSTGNSTFNVGEWRILLNNEELSLDKDITLNDFAYQGDSHTEEGYLAPGGTATMDIAIDATHVSTAISYDLDIDSSALDDFPNMSLEVLDVDTNQIITGDYVGQIMLTGDSRQKNLRIVLSWNNDPLYDENDVQVFDKDFSLNVHMHFTQLQE